MPIEIIYAAFGILCAVVGYKMALRRKRNAPLWAFLCFLFAPALGLLYMSPKAIADSDAYRALDEKWGTLIQYDPELKGAAERLSPLGNEAVERFKRIYAEHQDKNSIPLIVADIEREWATRSELGLRQHGKHAGVEILADRNGLFHVEGKTTRDLATARVLATGAARRR